MHCHTTREQQVVGLLWSTATMVRSSKQWDSLTALPHYWEAAGGRTPFGRCHTVEEQPVVGLLHCTAALLRSSGQWDTLSTLPH